MNESIAALVAVKIRCPKPSPHPVTPASVDHRHVDNDGFDFRDFHCLNCVAGGSWIVDGEISAALRAD
jgi:hypothetical protein